MKGVALKRTLTVSFELTPYHYNQIKRLGGIRWPDQHLLRDELCRRLLLAGCDNMIAGDLSSSPRQERLLEPACSPVRMQAKLAAARG